MLALEKPLGAAARVSTSYFRHGILDVSVAWKARLPSRCQPTLRSTVPGAGGEAGRVSLRFPRALLLRGGF